MVRVPLDQLEELDDFDSFADVRYQGQPFTGIGTEEQPRFVTEYRYENGRGHGRCTSTFRNGQLLEEFQLEHGRYVGESRKWNEQGQLLELRTWEQPRLTRRWWDSGVLRSERVGEETKQYTAAGELAFTWSPRTEPTSPMYARCTFDHQVMRANLEALVEERELENHVFAWVLLLLDTSRTQGIAVLERLLAHPAPWARLGAVRVIGNAKVVECEATLRTFLSDESVPPQQPGRAHTRTLAALTLETLRKLGLEEHALPPG